ncbi:unnamed protein product [Spirodela intermedia]|uniref:ribonuclease P n=1 Tax=Spirodela intermedia TaxID=51605 RepID=A0A7I8JFC3_SPIIN|nr:unnamed protein product [Spirodela intermedia]CAA6668435.1 unnamed protein product [Spirodela intermedia]
MLRLNSSSSPFLATFSRTLSLFTPRRRHVPGASRVLHSAPLLFSLKETSATRKRPLHRHHRHINGGAAPSPSSSNAPPAPPPEKKPNSQAPQESPLSRKAMLKARRESPEGFLRHKLDMCSKGRSTGSPPPVRRSEGSWRSPLPVPLQRPPLRLHFPSPTGADEPSPPSTAAPLPETAKLGIERGFEIFRQMELDSVPPNEATFTSLARLAAAKEDPELAFKVIEEMSSSGIPPKLRTYGPALFGFCSNGDTERAFEVEAHMAESGVLPEEEELSALLRVSAAAGEAGHVYRLLHRLRSTVRQVSAATAEIAEGWFQSEAAGLVGLKDWDAEKDGDQWRWRLQPVREKLVSIDIDPVETENFAKSLATLASQREVKADFNRFQEWLDRNGPFDAVIDGANVGLANQHHFSFFQLNSVVNGIRQMSPAKKPPLVVLHSRRVKGGPADNLNNKKLLESWKRSGALYSTPPGSNDDWYWLYAAVSCRSLLVTNDEMRDHLFQLLGRASSQDGRRSTRSGLSFHMPPPYSIVIQESEGGRWHVPTVEGDDIDSPRQWVCAARASAPPPKLPAISPWQLRAPPPVNPLLSSSRAHKLAEC